MSRLIFVNIQKPININVQKDMVIDIARDIAVAMTNAIDRYKTIAIIIAITRAIKGTVSIDIVIDMAIDIAKNIGNVIKIDRDIDTAIRKVRGIDINVGTNIINTDINAFKKFIPLPLILAIFIYINKKFNKETDEAIESHLKKFIQINLVMLISLLNFTGLDLDKFTKLEDISLILILMIIIDEQKLPKKDLTKILNNLKQQPIKSTIVDLNILELYKLYSQFKERFMNIEKDFNFLIECFKSIILLSEKKNFFFQRKK